MAKYMIVLSITLGAIIGFIALLGVQAFLAGRGVEPFQSNPDTQVQTFGDAGTPVISYLVLGDSTAAGQGADYDEGIAVQTAQYLAQGNRVLLKNLAVSGATTQEVADNQLPRIGDFKPDVVLLSSGANDTTSFTSVRTVSASLTTIIEDLRRRNGDVQIFITGVPDMGSIPRLPEPLRSVIGFRGNQLNRTFAKTAAEQGVVFIDIAKRTGPAFRQNPDIFSSDSYHPDERGYQLWTDAIIDVMRRSGL